MCHIEARKFLLEHPALPNDDTIGVLCSMNGSSAEPGSTPISKASQQKGKLRRLISRSRSRKLHSREEGESLLLEGPMSSLSLDEDPVRGNADGQPWWEKDARRARGQGPVEPGLQSEWHLRDAQAPSESGRLRAAVCSPLPPPSLPSSSGSSYTPFSGSGYSTTPDSVLQPHAEDRHKTPFTVYNQPQNCFNPLFGASSVTPSPTAQVPKPPTVLEGSASDGSLELATPAVQAEQAHRPQDHVGGGDQNTPVFNLHARLDAAG